MIFSGIVAFCVFGLVSSAPGKLPETFPRCKRTDPKLNECLEQAFTVAFPQMISGIPSLGVLPIDPLEIKALNIAQGTGPVAIDLKLTDLKITGLKNIKLTKFNADLDNYVMELEGIVDGDLHIDSNYESTGNVLVLPISGKGTAHLIFKDPKATIKITGKNVQKGGKKYWEVEKLVLNYNISRLVMNFEGLLSKEKTLADNLNAFLNENWEEIHKEVKPGIEQGIGAAFQAIVSRIMSKVPYDDIFLP